MKSFLSRLPRAVGQSLFRLHIENGVAVAVGVGLIGVGTFWLAGFEPAIRAATGALCASVVDRPDPLSNKPAIMARAFLPLCLANLAAGFIAPHPLYMVLATALIGLWAGMVTAFGRLGVSLGMATILAFVFGVEEATHGGQALSLLALYFVPGAAVYSLYAVAVAYVTDDRSNRLLIAETTRAFVQYLNAKAAMFGGDGEGPLRFRNLIESHTALVEQLQLARDALFLRARKGRLLHRLNALVALLDAFELILSSDADIELLRRSGQQDLMRRIGAVIADLAQDMERITRALRGDFATIALKRHDPDFEAIADAIARKESASLNEEEQTSLAAFRSTAGKLARASARIRAFAEALDKNAAVPETINKLDLAPFAQKPRTDLAVLKDNLSLASPALRYAIRLSLAMVAGLLVTYAYAHFSRGAWVVLTVAFVMRANYSVTRKRRWQRISGTLVGCVIAMSFISLVSPQWLWLLVLVGIGISHAYALVDYRVTTVAATSNALLLLHFLTPGQQPLFVERIADTLIAAAISYVFAFLLPTWERADIPRIVKRLLDADTRFAMQALCRMPVEHQYRLARKHAVDAVAALSGAIRRIADEPNINRRLLASLNELLGANYLLASDLASMQVVFLHRKNELEPERTDQLVGEVRGRVASVLSLCDTAPMSDADERLSRRGLTGMDRSSGRYVLNRRLIHVEHMAARVARLARRVVAAS